jgi:hypothetical protein
MKLRYFEEKWDSRREWIEMARKAFEKMYNDYREKLGQEVLFPTANLPALEERSILNNWKFGNTTVQVHKNELEMYLDERVENPEVSPREWWILRKSRFPILASMAWDMMSIPAMSAEVERVFSGYVPGTKLTTGAS